MITLEGYDYEKLFKTLEVTNADFTDRLIEFVKRSDDVMISNQTDHEITSVDDIREQLSFVFVEHDAKKLKNIGFPQTVEKAKKVFNPSDRESKKLGQLLLNEQGAKRNQDIYFCELDVKILQEQGLEKALISHFLLDKIFEEDNLMYIVGQIILGIKTVQVAIFEEENAVLGTCSIDKNIGNVIISELNRIYERFE